MVIEQNLRLTFVYHNGHWKMCSTQFAIKYYSRKTKLCTLSTSCLFFASKYGGFIEGSCLTGIRMFTFQLKLQRRREEEEEIFIIGDNFAKMSKDADWCPFKRELEQ